MNRVGLKRIGNTIVTKAPHPTGVRKYAQINKQITAMYDDFIGTEPNPRTSSDFLSKYEKWIEKISKLRQLNLWRGANISTKVGKHKVPRYLYHITTKENYNKMLKDGFLKTANECATGEGVFFFELQNMIKNYSDVFENKNLSALFSQVIMRGDEAVLLRIPTTSLDAGKLAIRTNYSGRIVERPKSISCLGDTALNSKLYKQRKEAIEYIYPTDIPMKNISVVGKTKFKSDNFSEKEALNYWKILTKNQPEQNAFNAIKNIRNNVTEEFSPLAQFVIETRSNI